MKKLGILASVIVAACVAIGVLLGVSRRQEVPAEAPATDRRGMVEEAHKIAAPNDTLQTSRAELRDPDVLVLRVEDSETAAPLDQAKLIALPKDAGRSISSSLPATSISDENGLMRLVPSRLPALRHAITRSGFVASRVQLQLHGLQTMRLRRGHGFQLRFLDRAGTPVVGCVAAVSRLPIGYPEVHRNAAEGDPESPAAAWSALSFDDGLASFAGLPPGSYFIGVSHPWMCPKEASAFATVNIPSETERTIILSEVSAVVVAAPSKSPIVWHRWKLDPGGLLRNPCVNSLSATARAQLQERFPEAVVLVGLSSSPDGGLPVDVEAGLADGSWGTLSWGLRPLSEIQNPAFLEIKGRSELGTIHVVVRSGGKEVSGIPLIISSRDGAGDHRLGSGETIPVAAGAYGVEMAAPNPALDPHFERVKIVVGIHERRQVTVDIPQSIACLTVAPALPQEQYDVPIHVGVQLSNGDSMTRANWLPEHGPVRFWLPEGKIKVTASASGYAKAVQDVEFTTAQESATIVLELGYLPENTAGKK